MIEMDTLDVVPPDESIQTKEVPKPEPDSDPIDIFEVDRLLDFSTVPGGKDKAILFSGGDDSLALVHHCMEQGWANFVIHLATNSEIPANIDYVRSICEEYQWPLAIISSPVELDTFAYRYGFPGPDKHTDAYHSFKGRQLGHFYRRRSGGVKFFSGVRKLESGRRMKKVKAEVQYSDTSKGGNFSGWWISPLINASDTWVADYREKHDLPRNPVAEKLNRSGDCQCLAYGHRLHELVDIQAHYPDYAEWVLNVEKRVQEYRGRVMHLEEMYPEISDKLDQLRKETLPHPMRLTLLKEHYPSTYDEIVAIPQDNAILKGQTDQTSYIGHGGMSSNDLRELTSSSDEAQTTLCETCSDTCESVVPVVTEMTERAKEKTESIDHLQSQLPVDVEERPIAKNRSNTDKRSVETTQQTLADA